MFVGIVQTKFHESDPEVPILPPKDVIVSPVPSTSTWHTALLPSASTNFSTGYTVMCDSRPTKHHTRNPSPSPHLGEDVKAFGQHITCPYRPTTAPYSLAAYGNLVKTSLPRSVILFRRIHNLSGISSATQNSYGYSDRLHHIRRERDRMYLGMRMR